MWEPGGGAHNATRSWPGSLPAPEEAGISQPAFCSPGNLDHFRGHPFYRGGPHRARCSTSEPRASSQAPRLLAQRPQQDILLVLIFQALPIIASPSHTTQSNPRNCQKNGLPWNFGSCGHSIEPKGWEEAPSSVVSPWPREAGGGLVQTNTRGEWPCSCCFLLPSLWEGC